MFTKTRIPICALVFILAATVVQAQTSVPLFDTGNVLAVGCYNDHNGSSDLIVGAELSDNNGVVYVDNALGSWTAGTMFNWKIVLHADGSGAEEPGWQGRGFDDSGWNHDTTLGFPIGHGTSSENGKFDLPLVETDETIYTRSVFDAQNAGSITELTIKVAGDDSAAAWFNGVYIGVTGVGTSDRGEGPEDFVFDTTISSGSFGAWDQGDPFAFTGTGTAVFTVSVGAPSGVQSWELYE